MSHHCFCAASIAFDTALGAYLAAAASNARYAAVVVGKTALLFEDKVHVPSDSDGNLGSSKSVKVTPVRMLDFVRISDEVGVWVSAFPVRF